MIEIFKLAAIGNRGQLVAGSAIAIGNSRLLLRAVIAQRDGDVDGAIRLLRRALLSAPRGERAALADTLAPMLVMRHQNAYVEQLADILEGDEWRASAYAFRALVAADTRKRDLAQKHMMAAEHALEAENDDVIHLLVLQRLSRTAFYLNDSAKSFDYAISCASLCRKLEAWRIAAACYSVAYVIQHHVLQDRIEAARYATLWLDAAHKSGDESFVHAALAAQYEFAVQYGDDGQIEALDAEIKRRLLPEQYAERFQLLFASALVRGKFDIVAMRAILQIARELPDLTLAKWSLCTALIALADAAAYDDESARRELREAASGLGRPALREPAYEAEYRRFTRIVVATTCVLLNDDVRAQRILAVREMLCEDSATKFLAMMRSGDWQLTPPRMQGLSRVLQHAYQKRHSVEPPAGLTPTEFDVLRLLAEGWQAKRIAMETGRSVHTVYSHTRSILAKLDASRAPQAVANARKRGLIE